MVGLMMLVSCNRENTSTEEPTTSVITTSDQDTRTEEQTTHEINCSFNINLDISNGSDQIDPIFVMCLAYGDGSGEDFTADGFCIPYDFVGNKASFPLIIDSQDLSLVTTNVLVHNIEVFDLAGEQVTTWTSLEEHPNLDTGDYIIRLSTRLVEDECLIEGDHYFILQVE